MNNSSEIERQKEVAIDALRLKAFETNSDADRQAYFDAVSKWFQDRHIRRVDAERFLSALEPSAARELALEALNIAYASMEGSCSANHRIAMNTVDAAIRSLSSPDHADAGIRTTHQSGGDRHGE